MLNICVLTACCLTMIARLLTPPSLHLCCELGIKDWESRAKARSQLLVRQRVVFLVSVSTVAEWPYPFLPGEDNYFYKIIANHRRNRTKVDRLAAGVF
jgi:hypothetical protein